MWPPRKILILFTLLLLPTTSFALSSDRNQPIKIKADSVVLNEKTGISVYKGNVVFSQGSLILKGNRIVIYQTRNKTKSSIHKIVVTGKPAVFQQQQDNVKQLVKAKAGKMEFITKNERVYLSQNASVSQGDNLLKGEQIEYNTRTSTVTAKKGADNNNRVHAVIEPNKPKSDIPESNIPRSKKLETK